MNTTIIYEWTGHALLQHSVVSETPKAWKILRNGRWGRIMFKSKLDQIQWNGSLVSFDKHLIAAAIMKTVECKKQDFAKFETDVKAAVEILSNANS